MKIFKPYFPEKLRPRNNEYMFLGSASSDPAPSSASEDALARYQVDLFFKSRQKSRQKKVANQMSETFFKATQNEKMTDSFKQFCEYFAKNLKLESPPNQSSE